MTITVAVTGGIGAGKSTVSGLLAARGAVVVDSDRLAREVVGVGTPGLSAIAEEFGPDVITADGALDRPALASVVFADASARRRLEGITHPLVRARFAELEAAAPPDSVVVNDIPLLTTRSAAAAFHLVIGVGAPREVRLERLLNRGLTVSDATARISAQIDDQERRLLCDVWVDNSAGVAEVRRQADQIWSRLAAYAANVRARRGAPRPGPTLVPYRPDWPERAERLMHRLRYLVGEARIDHVGSTAVPALPARDVIDLQLTVSDLGQAADFEPLLTAGGFPVVRDITTDTPHPDAGGEVRPELWSKRLHVNADPGQRLDLHVRVGGSPGWHWALRFRDWLRSDPGARADYLTAKQLAAAQGGDPSAGGYAAAKESFLAAADGRILRWAESTGWQPS